MSWLRHAPLVILLAGLTAVVFGQDTPEQGGARDLGTKEKVGVHLVQVPILALDRQGRPVTDLRADELVVKHRGTKVRIAYLEPLRPASIARSVAPGLRLEVEAPGGYGTESPGLGQNQHLLLFLDVQNDDKLRREDAEAGLLGFVQALPPTLRVSVASFDGELHLDLPFTTDRHAVVSALQRAWGRPGQPRLDLHAKTRALVSRFEDCVIEGNEFQRVADERCIRDVAREYAEEVRPAAHDYLKALEGVVTYAGGLQGGKVVIAVSHGVPVDVGPVVLEALRSVIGNSEQLAQVQLYLGFGDSPEVQRDKVTSLAVRTRVALHFVDRTSPPTGDGGANRSSRFMAGSTPLAASHVAAQEDLKEFAAATGGTFHASTRLLPGLQAAMAARDAAYELGYYLDEYLPRKKMDKLSVDTARRGVKIVHRAGYYAEASEVARAMNGRIVVSASGKEPAVTGNFVRLFQIAADPRQMGYRMTDSEAVANFTLYVALKDAEGHVLTDSYHFINHAYPRTSWDKKDVGEVLINGWFEVPPGSYELVATFRNTDTPWEGQVIRTVTLEAPRPSAS